MARSPMMPFWTDAYLGDTRHLTTLEHGAYMLLLITAWRSKDGILPDDDKILARFSGLTVDKWKKIRPVLEQFFDVENGQWLQGRLLDERKADSEFRKNQSEKAKARHLKNKETTHAAASSRHMPPPSPSPSPSQSDTNVSEPYIPFEEKPKRKRSEKKQVEKPECVPQQIWDDFLEIRKTKKAPLTQTAWNGIVNQSRKAGLPIEAALEICCQRGWAGFNAEWINQQKPTKGNENGKRTSHDELREFLDESRNGGFVRDAHLRLR